MLQFICVYINARTHTTNNPCVCTLKLIFAYKLRDKHTACYRDAFSVIGLICIMQLTPNPNLV